MGLFMDAAQWDEIDKLAKQIEKLSAQVEQLTQENNDLKERVAKLEQQVNTIRFILAFYQQFLSR